MKLLEKNSEIISVLSEFKNKLKMSIKGNMNCIIIDEFEVLIRNGTYFC